MGTNVNVDLGLKTYVNEGTIVDIGDSLMIVKN
jgi:hypothetical protein